MTEASFGRSALSAAWLGGGGVFVALAAWNWTGSAEQARFVRLGVVWMLFGVAHVVTASNRASATVGRGSKWSKLQSGLLGVGLGLLLVGFVVSGPFLVWLGVAGLLLIAVAALAGR